jgi:hypothetical protein
MRDKDKSENCYISEKERKKRRKKMSKQRKGRTIPKTPITFFPSLCKTKGHSLEDR